MIHAENRDGEKKYSILNLHPDVIRALDETGVELFEVASYRGLTNGELYFALQTYDQPDDNVKMIHELAKLPAHERMYGIDEDGNPPKFINRRPPGNIVSIIRSDMDGCENFLYLVYHSKKVFPHIRLGYGVQLPYGDGMWVDFWQDSKKAWDAFQKLYPLEQPKKKNKRNKQQCKTATTNSHRN